MLLDWLKLTRATGLVTVLSNCTAAVVVAVYASDGLDPKWLVKRLYQSGFSDIACLLAASALLYLAGMLWNDLADVDRDRTLHPRRPLPSGRIGLGAAFFVGILLAVGALVCAALVDVHAFYAAGVVLSIIMLYNLVTKDIPYIGSVTMAAVRFSHAIFALLLLGSDYLKLAILSFTSGEQNFLLTYPIILGVYIFGVTLVSELESRAARRVELIIGGTCIMGAIAAAGWQLATAHWIRALGPGDSPFYVIGIGAAAVMGAGIFCWLVYRVGKPWITALTSGRADKIPPVVGAALGGIIFLDAVIATSAHPIGGLVIMCLVPIFMLGRKVVRMD
jgi:4-hydroxybenzoate polyprenyltransferase